MGKGNAAVKQWLSNRERFADLFNGMIFEGEQVILAEDLEPTDTESDILVTDKEGKTREVQRHRDIVMKWRQGVDLVLLACENQAKVHYAMPVRNMLYDSLSYTEQVRQKKEQNENRENLSQEEFLSGFSKDDRICPVITLVLYYDTKEWDGSVDLYGMFSKELEGKRELLKKYIPNYWINLVDAGNLEHAENFHTDLHEILGMLKYRNQKEQLLQYMKQNEAYFRNVDEETYHVIREFLHSEKILKEQVNKRKEAEGVDMCKALEELYQDGVDMGISQGIRQGISQGRTDKLMEQITKKLDKGYTAAEIADMLEESEETILKMKTELGR